MTVAEREGLRRRFAPSGPPFGRYPRFVTLAANRSKPTKIYLMYGGEGGIARRYAPRPFAPLRDRRRLRAGVSLLNRPAFIETQPLTCPPEVSSLLAEREGFEPSKGF